MTDISHTDVGTPLPWAVLRDAEEPEAEAEAEAVPEAVPELKELAFHAFSEKMGLFGDDAIVDAHLIGTNLRLTFGNDRKHLFEGKDSWFRKGNFQSGLMVHLKIYADVPAKKWESWILSYIVRFATSSPGAERNSEEKLLDLLYNVPVYTFEPDTKLGDVAKAIHEESESIMRVRSAGLSGDHWSMNLHLLFRYRDQIIMPIRVLPIVMSYESIEMAQCDMWRALSGLGWTPASWNCAKVEAHESYRRKIAIRIAPQSFFDEKGDTTNG